MNDLFILLLLLTPLAFLAGMVKPGIYNKVLKKELGRKQLSKYFGVVFVVLFVLVGVTTPSSGKEGVTQEAKQEDKETKREVQDQSSPSPETIQAQELYSVTRVIDGDTLEVSINGQVEDIRLIGINTPETVDPRKPVECFGKEASKKASDTLSGKNVKLEADPSQGERDKYSRLLRYVFLEDGTHFNKLMISEGYAYEYTYDLPYKYQQEFKEAQKQAQENKRGITPDIYDKKLKEYKSLQADLLQQMQEHSNADESYHLTAARILDVSRRALEIFESSEPNEKRQFLNFLLQNYRLRGKTPMFTLKPVFAGIVSAHKTSNWLGSWDSNPGPIG